MGMSPEAHKWRLTASSGWGCYCQVVAAETFLPERAGFEWYASCILVTSTSVCREDHASRREAEGVAVSP